MSYLFQKDYKDVTENKQLQRVWGKCKDQNITKNNLLTVIVPESG